MSGLELDGVWTPGEHKGTCVWCQRPTDSTIYAQGLGKSVPMCPTCGMAMMYAYKRWLRGALLPGKRSTERITRLLGPSPLQLEPGS